MIFLALKTEDGRITGKISFYCRMLGISRQGFYKYLANKDRPWKYQDLADAMKEIICEDECNDTYGRIRMYQALLLKQPEGVHIPSERTVYRVMDQIGLSHRSKRKPNGLTKADREAMKSDDLLKRDFHSDAPLEKCITDITEIPACNGKLYVSAISDCFDLSVLGLSMGTNMKADLCIQTLENALTAYPTLEGAIIHSDRGTQYTSESYRQTIREHHIHQSEMVEPLYCEDNGRPSIDPVVLFKMVLIQHLYGLPSLRRTAEEVSGSIYYRWFLGYTLQDETPHFSTVSYNFRHRFTEETVDQVFRWILEEVAEAGYLSPKAVFIDGTHIKANANTKKQVKAQVPAASKHYAKELMEEVNADREAHGKKPFDDDDEPPAPAKKRRDNTSKKKLARRKKEKKRTVTRSVTDPDSGLFVKGDHKRQFAYEAHTACDKHGFVLETVVTPGNVHDSVAFDEVYDRVTEAFPEVETIVADSAYKTPHICKKVFEDGRVLSTAYKRPQTLKGGHEWWKYVYDEHYDCVLCPEYQVLAYRTTNRDGYREYRSDPKICAGCPTRHLCTHSKDCVKTVQRHIWKDYEELADDARYTPKYKNLYKRRKETIERVFADAKEKHAMRYTQYRGLTQVANWVKLKFAAMNLKKLARWLWKENSPSETRPAHIGRPGFSTD